VMARGDEDDGVIENDIKVWNYMSIIIICVVIY
jgi:hypothetical protein